MRLERLILLRYGHFRDRELDLGDREAGLHVVYGANEAGKTTALRAIGDLLFGIDPRSPYGYLHGYQDMRIGAEISAASGRRLTFRRRKGQKNTLLDDGDAALPDDALRPFLGAADRVLFEGLYGLSHQALRTGGEDMLAAKGDLGRMLFEAGGSVRHLVTVLDGLEREAAELFMPRKSKERAFYKAFDAYVDARKRVRDLSVTSDEWRRNEDALRDAEEALETARRRLGELQAGRDKAERIYRLLPRLARLRQAKADLADVAEAPPLPEDARQHVERAQHDLALAAAEAEREIRDAAAAENELAQVLVPASLLAVAADVRIAVEQRGAVIKADRDLPNRIAERDLLRRELWDLAHGLGVDVNVDSLRDRLPPEAAIAGIRSLIREAAAIDAEVAAAEGRVTDAGSELSRIERDLEDLPAVTDVDALARMIDDLRAKGDLEGAVAEARRAADAAAATVARAVAALPFWTDDADRLAAAPVPDASTVTRFETDITAATEALRRSRDRLRDDADALARLNAEMAELMAGGDVPSADMVAEARRHRDAGWRLIRRRHIDGGALSEEEAQEFAAGQPLADAYERSVAAADLVADRKEAEASRVAHHTRLRTAVEAGRRRVRDLEAVVAAEEDGLRRLGHAWRTAWSGTGVEPLSPREMAGWLGRRADVLREIVASRQAGTDLRRAEDTLGRAVAALRPLAEPHVGPLATDETLSTLLARCDALVKLTERQAGERRNRLSRRDEQRMVVRRETQGLRLALRRRRQWRTAWRAAVGAIGLPADITVAAVESSLGTWEKVRSKVVLLDDLAHRIRAMDEDSSRFAAFVADIAGHAALAIDVSDPLEAAAQMSTRLAEAEAALTRKTDLEQRLSKARSRLAQAEQKRFAGEAILAQLRGVGGCSNDEALLTQIGRAERKRSLLVEMRDLEASILDQADGLTVDQAAAEAEGHETDRLKQDIAGINHEIEDMMEKRTALGETIKELGLKRREMGTGRGAAEAEEDKHDAAAALEDVSERWMVLRTAVFVLRRAIDRFRREQQGPLLARAGELFQSLTLGSFTGFRVDYDERDEAILRGERPDGTACAVDGMSDGTRDQLFLSLRLAAIERYATAVEPLPFVADDLFVNFDDDRARAGLRQLIDLGQSTQVLFFTHHRHLVDLAAGCNGTRRIRVLDL